MIGWRNVWSMKLRVQEQEEDQRGPGEVVREDCQARKMNKEDTTDRCKWRKMIKDVRWSGWVWVGECFFWYRPTRVVPDQRPLNGCVCVCVCVHTMAVCLSVCLSQANIIWKGWTDLAHFSTEATFALSYTVLEGNSGIPRKNGTSLWHCVQNSLKFCHATSTTASVVSLVWPAIINSLSHWASTWSST